MRRPSGQFQTRINSTLADRAGRARAAGGGGGGARPGRPAARRGGGDGGGRFLVRYGWFVVEVGEHVAGAAPGVDERARGALVHFFAQPVNVDLDGVGERIVVLVPDVLAELSAPHHPTGLAGEVLEHDELLAR